MAWWEGVFPKHQAGGGSGGSLVVWETSDLDIGILVATLPGVSAETGWPSVSFLRL